MSLQTAKAILTPMCPENTKNRSVKITVVGCGQVGMACVFAILSQQICSELCLIDQNDKRALGEAIDMAHGCPFIHGCPKITSSADYCKSAGSWIIVVTAGARQNEGESRLSLVQRNVEIFKCIIPPLAKSSPECIFVIVSNPCDILSYVTMKLTQFPANRVIGSGCNLDSARFRNLISERLKVAPISVHAWIIGEHGDSSVAVWSGVNVSGVRLADINPSIGTSEDPEKWSELHTQVINSAYEIISLKGYTNWGIGLSVGHICSVIIRDTREVLPISTYIKGCKHGVDKDVYLSLPVVLGANGVLYIVKQALSQAEKKGLQDCANNLYELQRDIKLDA